jgi:hypothetical protein
MIHVGFRGKAPGGGLGGRSSPEKFLRKMCIFDAPRAILALEKAKLGSMKFDGKIRK